MKEIPLTRGLVAIVDDEDFEWLNQWKWCARRRLDERTQYAGRQTPDPTRRAKQRMVFMHRLIVECPDGMVVDHINGNGLDNRRSNLRICTHAENLRNRGGNRGSTSKYKGVSRCAGSRSNPWQALIESNRKKYLLGYFPTEEAAARAYDAKALELHGAFARTNFPQEATL